MEGKTCGSKSPTRGRALDTHESLWANVVAHNGTFRLHRYSLGPPCLQARFLLSQKESGVDSDVCARLSLLYTEDHWRVLPSVPSTGAVEATRTHAGAGPMIFPFPCSVR